MAGFGAAAMLTGGLMVVTPAGAGANPGQGAGGNPSTQCGVALDALIDAELVPAGTQYLAGAKWEWQDQSQPVTDEAPSEDDGLAAPDGVASWSTDGTNVNVSFSAMDKVVHAAIVSQAGAYEDPILFEPASISGAFNSETDDLSNFTLCHFDFPQDEPEGPTLRVEKVVVGDSDGATFAIDVTLLGEVDELVAEDAPIADAADGFWELEDAAGTYSIEEVDDGGADSTSWECFAGDASEPFAQSGAEAGDDTFIDDIEVAEEDVTCVFTNTFTPDVPTVVVVDQFGSLSVDKVVDGPTAPAASTAYEFAIACTNGLDESFTLTSGDDPRVFANLPAGASCTVTETEAHGAATTTYAVNGVAGATATIAANATQAVVVTNTFPAVLPGEEEPPPVTPPVPPVEPPPAVTPPVETPPQPQPAVQPQAEVRGDVVTRTLPRTGNESRDLAASGAGLLLLGAGLVLASRARFARIG